MKRPYKLVCISLYVEDIDRLATKVEKLKERGVTKANKSALIRFALDNVNLDELVKADRATWDRDTDTET